MHKKKRIYIVSIFITYIPDIVQYKLSRQQALCKQFTHMSLKVEWVTQDKFRSTLKNDLNHIHCQWSFPIYPLAAPLSYRHVFPSLPLPFVFRAVMQALCFSNSPPSLSLSSFPMASLTTYMLVTPRSVSSLCFHFQEMISEFFPLETLISTSKSTFHKYSNYDPEIDIIFDFLLTLLSLPSHIQSVTKSSPFFLLNISLTLFKSSYSIMGITEIPSQLNQLYIQDGPLQSILHTIVGIIFLQGKSDHAFTWLKPISGFSSLQKEHQTS